MGVPLATALTQASRDIRMPAFTRCVDSVVTGCAIAIAESISTPEESSEESERAARAL